MSLHNYENIGISLYEPLFLGIGTQATWIGCRLRYESKFSYQLCQHPHVPYRGCIHVAELGRLGWKDFTPALKGKIPLSVH